MTDEIVEVELDDAIEKLEGLFARLLAAGDIADAADALVALTYLKHERGDDDE